MGKKRIALVGENQPKNKSKKPKKIVVSGKQSGRLTDMGQIALKEAEEVEKKQKEAEKSLATETVKAVRTKRPVKKRGKRYLSAKTKIESAKVYPLKEAIKLLKSVSISRFNASIDVHLVTQSTGLKGEIEFPHPTGKASQIAIANEKLLKEIGKGKIDFNVLLATPQIMPKLAKYAKILGPKGLMPNPKAGTISEHPEELARKLAGKTRFKTENKAPLIHLTIGKLNDKLKFLEENFKALIDAVGTKNVKKAVIASSMSPGIKVDLASI